MPKVGGSGLINADIMLFGAHFRNKKNVALRDGGKQHLLRDCLSATLGREKAPRGGKRRKKQITSSLLPIIAEKEALLKSPSLSAALERFDGLYIRKPNGAGEEVRISTL